MIFFYELELGHNTAKTTRNISAVFVECAATKYTMRHWFKKFYSRDISFENEGPDRPKIVL